MPPQRNVGFADLIEENPTSVPWHSASETKQLLAKMSPLNLLKLEQAKRIGRRVVGCVYKRTRLNENGVKVQRALTMSLDACELRREVPAAR